MTKRRVILATRESPLAMRQSQWVKGALQKQYPHLAVDFLGITTKADKLLDMSLVEIGGKGLFIKELEEALLDGRADIAVHSMKDMPMDVISALAIPAICEREDARDVFVSNQYASFWELRSGASIATSSLRRQTQLLSLRSDIILQNLRGNIDSRFKRLDEGEFDALILAGAGLKRMDLNQRIRQYFSLEEILPPPGQGAIGIECRADDQAIIDLLKPLDHAKTHASVVSERAVCKRLGGGCNTPIAAFAEVHHDKLILRSVVADRRGMKVLRVKQEGDPKTAEAIGMRAAEELLQQGAEKILREFII